MKRIFYSVVILSCLLLCVACGGGGETSLVGGGGGESSDRESLPSVASKLLASEFGDDGNWTAYETYDQLEDSDIPPNALPLRALSTKCQFADLDHAPNAIRPAAANSVKREKIVTFTSNGLVSEFFEYLVSNSDGIAMGSRNYGVSVMKFTDLNSPRGMVFNYRKDSLEGIAEYQDKFYAWFLDGSLVDVATGEVIFENAPFGTNRIFSTIPKNRFVIADGDFYIGTSGLDSDGSQIADADNGLWMIDASFSFKTKLIDHPVWCIYKDSDNDIWVGTMDGIYKGNDTAFTKVFNGIAEQVFEFNDQTYALIKNFFHYPGDNNDFDLYRWNGADFDYVCEVSAVYGVPSIFEMYAFEWENTLYVSVRGAQDRLLVFDDDADAFMVQTNQIYEGKIGQQCATVSNGKLFTVGNLTGLNIWDRSQYFQLNTVNTAEALISNAIKVLYVAENGDLWIGPEASGFNILDDQEEFELIELAEETTIAGFFERNGTNYVQGAGALFKVDGGAIERYANFASNGERVYYDANHGKLWAFPNHGAGNGAIGMLDVDTKMISGTTGKSGRSDYWQRDYEWDKPAYHFNDVISIPDEDAVFIAVDNSDYVVLRYDYHTDEFSEVDIPIESIKFFDASTSAVFGVGQGSIVKYEKGAWEVVGTGLASEAPYCFAVKHNFAFIPARDHMAVVHLISGKTSTWTFDELPIKGEVTSIKMRTNQHPGVLTKAYSMVIGTTKGLVICNLNLQ